MKNNKTDIDRLLIYWHLKGEINISEFIEWDEDISDLVYNHYIGYGIYTVKDSPYGLVKNGKYYVVPFNKIQYLYNWALKIPYLKQFNIKIECINGCSFIFIIKPISIFNWSEL